MTGKRPGPSHGSADDYVYAPASRLWIYTSLALSWLLVISPFSGSSLLPDFLALSIAFWSVYEFRLLGMLLPFALGLLTDISQGVVLGQYALAYTLLAYGGQMMRRRIPWFGFIGQSLHILPLFLASQLVVLFIRLWLGGVFPGWPWLGQSFVNAVFWPIWSMILIMPQRRRSTTRIRHEGN